MSHSTTNYLWIDKIKIKAANAISSPITYGFPAVNGFLGAIHALSRKIPRDQYSEQIYLDGVLIAHHESRLHASRSNSYREYTFNQQRLPALKTGRPPAIIEEGRIDLTVSLVVEVKSDGWGFEGEEEKQRFTDWVKNQLMQQRIASGSVMSIGNVALFEVTESSLLIPQLLPAYVLLTAEQDFKEITEILQDKNPESTGIDTLLEMSKLHFIPHEKATEDDEKMIDESDKKSRQVAHWEWEVSSFKKGRGWLIPLCVGYQAIFPQFSKGIMKEARFETYPVSYVEPIYSLGKWVFPYRLDQDSFSNAFWRYKNVEKDDELGLYQVIQTRP